MVSYFFLQSASSYFLKLAHSEMFLCIRFIFFYDNTSLRNTEFLEGRMCSCRGELLPSICLFPDAHIILLNKTIKGVFTALVPSALFLLQRDWSLPHLWFVHPDSFSCSDIYLCLEYTFL